MSIRSAYKRVRKDVKRVRFSKDRVEEASRKINQAMQLDDAEQSKGITKFN